MVVETAGGKKDTEKQKEEDVESHLPGYAETPAPPNPCWQAQNVRVKESRSGARCFFCVVNMLVFVALLALVIYMGVMHHRYKHELRRCREKPDEMMEDFVFPDPGSLDGNPPGNNNGGVTPTPSMMSTTTKRNGGPPHGGDDDDDHDDDDDDHHHRPEFWQNFAQTLEDCVNENTGVGAEFNIDPVCLRRKMKRFFKG